MRATGRWWRWAPRLLGHRRGWRGPIQAGSSGILQSRPRFGGRGCVQPDRAKTLTPVLSVPRAGEPAPVR